MDPAKLKVVELRAELSSRGLDVRGNKATLVERLREALEQETGEGEILNIHNCCHFEAKHARIRNALCNKFESVSRSWILKILFIFKLHFRRPEIVTKYSYFDDTR